MHLPLFLLTFATLGFVLVTALRKVNFPAFGTPTSPTLATILRVSFSLFRPPPTGGALVLLTPLPF